MVKINKYCSLYVQVNSFNKENMPSATTIDEVIDILQSIITTEIQLNSPLAFFPSLYQLVTIRVKHDVENQKFEDNMRMEQLDVCFANRYFEAYFAFKSGQPCSASWRVVFESSEKPLLVLQHLLTGMNAHINLDLGIAAAETMKGKPVEDIHHDFNTINQILADLTSKVQAAIGEVSPLVRLLDLLAGKSDTMLVGFSMTRARDGAWENAVIIHNSENQDDIILQRDRKISALGLSLIYPASRWVRTLLRLIGFFEKKDVGAIVQVMTV